VALIRTDVSEDRIRATRRHLPEDYNHHVMFCLLKQSCVQFTTLSKKSPVSSKLSRITNLVCIVF
jgi:hypothetical protein